jgi:hypothetical protein
MLYQQTVYQGRDLQQCRLQRTADKIQRKQKGSFARINFWTTKTTTTMMMTMRTVKKLILLKKMTNMQMLSS